MKRKLLVLIVSLLLVWIGIIAFSFNGRQDDIHTLFDYSKIEIPQGINTQRLKEIESSQYATLDNPIERFLVTRYVAREIRIEEDIITSMSDETQAIYAEYDAYIAIFIPYAEIKNSNGNILVERN